MLLTAALTYAARGWCIVPLHTPQSDRSCSCGDPTCAHVGKHPRMRDWQQMATTDETAIRAWWYRWPKANIGILTGRSSGLLVLDVDPGGASTIATQGGIADTLMVSTGSGTHYYLTHPDVIIPNAVRFLPGLDVRSDGGLVVAPPSLHQCGRRYNWCGSSAAGPLAAPPAWLLAALTSPAPSPRPAGPAQGGATPYALAALQREVHKVKQAAVGERNDQLNRAAFALGTIVGAGALDAETVINELTAAALAGGLSADETRRTITSGLRAGIQKPRTIAPPRRPGRAG